MNILYRRYSNSIGISDQEVGTRGAWWEKRRALLAYLKKRGHEVVMASKPSRASKGLWPYPVIVKPNWADLLMIEWGPTNWVFVREDIAETARCVQHHKGPIVFLCDDPEMLGGCFDPRTVTLFAQKNYRRWTLWLNTPYTKETLSSFLRFPREAAVVDAPFAALLRVPEKASKPTDGRLVYSGRGSGGREDSLIQLQNNIPVALYGREKEWKKLKPLEESPLQTARAAFYSRFTGSLALADKQHKNTGWRTGRAYHSLLAGTPVIAERSHSVLAEELGVAFSNPQEARECYDFLKQKRGAVWLNQVRVINKRRFESAARSVEL